MFAAEAAVVPYGHWGPKPRKLVVCVGIGKTEGRENFGFKGFHSFRFVVFEVVIAQNMQESVDHEVGEMGLERDALLFRLARKGFAGEGDIAQKPGHRAERLDLGEAQDVGGLVDLAPVAVELPLLSVASEDDSDLGGAGDLRLRLAQGFEDCGFGDRLTIVGPALGVAKDGDFERDLPLRAQRWFSAAFLAPSAS